ncbi:MAG: tripartite tricarboxylate transporter substrate binding protein [Alphaproteobacteria bacterium]|nr:tripartite tricarboxylate transporter substrate binding protein [Alphaproteobacteria bacterium]
MLRRFGHRTIAPLVAAAGLAIAGAPAAAQSQVTIVVSVAAGGSSDIGVRTIAAKVEQMGGPKFVIENRPGGGGVVATVGLKDAAPDGRTIMLSSYATHVINPAMPAGTPYDPLADFKHITPLFSFPLMLAVPSAVEAKSVAELVALAKKKQGGLSYASQGVGTAGHLLGELFGKATGAPLVHIPYRGAAPAVIDLVAGRVDMMFVGVLPSKGHIASGALRPLAVTSRTRMTEVPDVPTFVEAGHADVNSEFVWFGLTAPGKTPDAAIANLHAMFAKAVADPDLRQRLAGQGIHVGATSPVEFTARIKADAAKFGPIIKASGAKK